jgi:hypothetical protein
LYLNFKKNVRDEFLYQMILNFICVAVNEIIIFETMKEN